METNRRGLLLGLGSLIAAPTIVRAASLMPVKALQPIKWHTLRYAEANTFQLYSGYNLFIDEDLMFDDAMIKSMLAHA
jgi:hypothetical protein